MQAELYYGRLSPFPFICDSQHACSLAKFSLIFVHAASDCVHPVLIQLLMV